MAVADAPMRLPPLEELAPVDAAASQFSGEVVECVVRLPTRFLHPASGGRVAHFLSGDVKNSMDRLVAARRPPF